MAQKDQEQILKRAPHVDVVIGQVSLHGYPSCLREPGKWGRPACRQPRPRRRSRAAITASFEGYDADREPAMRPSPFQAFVRVMMGCDKFCTYCIVPSVRGPDKAGRPRQS